MVASGVDPQAEGMAPAATLYSWNSSGDDAEMAAAVATGKIVASNHSYSPRCGWDKVDGDWHWFGLTSVDQNESWLFGAYNNAARNWDEIAWNAPGYLIVKSAGNTRGKVHSGPHFHNNGTSLQSDSHERNGGTDKYDCLPPLSTAKNIVTVGAVEDIPNSYEKPGDVDPYLRSSWGPTDDGRIKPDLVANGTGVYSSKGDTDDDYVSWFGTSMSAPCITGSVALLTEQYRKTYAQEPLGSTMKGVLIHGCDEAGPDPGPDYMFGWGLANIYRSAQVIQTGCGIFEETLQEGEVKLFEFNIGSCNEFKVTLVWTDPPGEAITDQLNVRVPRLVHDLDMRVFHKGVNHKPWKLDPANPAAAATQGDNDRDNVEMISIAQPSPGVAVVEISHEGPLAEGSQAFSLIVSGMGTGADGTTFILENQAVSSSYSKTASEWIRTRNNFLTLPNSRTSLVAREKITMKTGTHLLPGSKGIYKLRTDECFWEPQCVLAGYYAMANKTNWPEEELEVVAKDGLVVFPNPASGQATVEFSLQNAGVVQLDLLDNLGRRVNTLANQVTFEPGVFRLPLDVSALPKGIYFVQWQAHGQRMTRKLVVQ